MLPKRRRRAIYAVYALARAVDDIADGAEAPSDKARALANWHDEVERLYAGAPSHPITRILHRPVRDYDLPQAEFHALIEGMETDAKPRVRVPTLEEMLRYCRRVAGSVGILCVHVFGLSQDPGPRFAVALGNAFQLTNILRDIPEDIIRDRLYLPLSLLKRHGVTPDPLADLICQAGLAPACSELAARAQTEYALAGRLMRQLGWWRTRPPALMKAIYEATLERLVARGWTQWDDSIRPGSVDRVWLILRHGLR